MKKYVVLLMVVSAIFVTGCGNDEKTSVMKCTKENEEVVITHQNDKILKIESSEVMEEEKATLDATYPMLEQIYAEINKVKGFEVKLARESDTKLKITMLLDYETLDIKALQEAMGEDATADDLISGKNLSLTDFQKENLEDFTCK